MLVHTAAEAGGGIQLFLPPLSEVILSAIIVLLIALVLVKYALPKYNEIVEERAKTIEEGIEATKKAKREADVAEAKAEGAILAAQQEAQPRREGTIKVNIAAEYLFVAKLRGLESIPHEIRDIVGITGTLLASAFDVVDVIVFPIIDVE